MGVPFLRTIVEIATGIGQDILATPPHVKVQHVNLREAVHNVSASKCSEVLRLAATQDMIPGVRKRDRGSRNFSERKVQYGRAAEPYGHFVPRPSVKHALFT